MNIPIFSALWCLLRALENFALAASALVLSDAERHAITAPEWRAESARCLSSAQRWLSRWEREVRDPIPA